MAFRGLLFIKSLKGYWLTLDEEPVNALAFKSVFETVLKKRNITEDDLDNLFNNNLKLDYYVKKNGYIISNITIV